MSEEEAVVTVGRLVEYTEEDRLQLEDLSVRLTAAIVRKEPWVARLTLEIFKVTQRAIRRSHAN